MIECQAQGCPNPGKHYCENPTNGNPFYLCGKHANDHAVGFGFELDTHVRLAKDEPATALLTGEGPTAILELPAHTIAITTDAGTYTYTKPQGGAMYSTISKAISILQDSLGEAQEALEEVQQKKSELDDAESELENMIDQLTSAIGAIEELDGASVSVDVDGVSVYISL